MKHKLGYLIRFEGNEHVYWWGKGALPSNPDVEGWVLFLEDASLFRSSSDSDADTLVKVKALYPAATCVDVYCEAAEANFGKARIERKGKGRA